MNGALLHLINVQYEDEGSYECETLNVKGMDWYRQWLYVEGKTSSNNKSLKDIKKDVGSELTLRCVAVGKPLPWIRWLKDGYSYGKGELKFSSLTFEDSGMYQCIAENEWGTIYASAELRVVSCAPTFIYNPVKKVLLGAENGRVVIECKPSAAPKPKFIWKRGSELLTNSSRFCDWFFFIFLNVNMSGSAWSPRWCPCGRDWRQSSKKLRWSLDQTTESFYPTVLQTRDFTPWILSDLNRIHLSCRFWTDLQSSTIVDLPWMQYEFRGMQSMDIWAAENSRPPSKSRHGTPVRPTVAPSDVLGQVGISGELIVTWTPVKPQFFFGKKFGYVVAFKQHEDSEWKWTTVEDPETRRYVYKDSMTPDTEIQVKVKTYNNKGEGPSSLISVVDSPRLAPTEAPLDVYARQVTATEALVWWLPIYQAPPNWVDGYQIRYWRKYDDNEAAASRVLVHRAINQTRLENMRPDSHYLIEVRAFNGAGLGPPSEHCEMFTRRPPPSRHLRVYKYVSFNRKWLYLYWDHIYNYWNESYVEGYKILFRKEGERYGKLYTTGRHYIDFPMPETGDYIIEVRARCEGGDGPISQIRVQGKAALGAESLSVASVLLLALGWMNLGL
ncbi:hypothetical protein cypCar_00021535 [Cyprinus carpio]|nr:hypothetical protein cypCar_00021535 [Cyprinus carpio]